MGSQEQILRSVTKHIVSTRDETNICNTDLSSDICIILDNLFHILHPPYIINIYCFDQSIQHRAIFLAIKKFN